MFSIKEISEELGVSTATVSRALDPRYSDKVKPTTRTRIMALCEAHNYRPKFSARALASGKTYTIGMIAPDVERTISSSNISQVISSMSEELKKFHYHLSILPIASDEPAEIDREIIHTFYSSQVDGFVLHSHIVGTLTLQELARHNFPVVVFSTPSNTPQQQLSASSVWVDNRAGYNELAAHLKQQRRHKIAYIGFQNNTVRRRRDCIDALRQAGLSFADSDCFLYPLPELTADNMLATYRYLQADWETLRHYDTWIMSNDYMARGACFFLEDRGFRPGDEIAVIGYDNLEGSQASRHLRPFITTVNPKLPELGITCARLLLEQIDGARGDYREVAIQSELIVRNSSGALNIRNN